ncbi:MAG TPA: sigma-70 family RNA polymerase sigma factor [Phycisphaerae bacterium]|nr:sigma-70 family RNA polymerase sigma factor [Phycisphaerae bacterium]HOJ75213.1 sigma-70 family RNA polymerase sigma factor [Phycisphaerae bacterium]HOM52436.1 sigma-70 family RNA polymerase sigma factor [Phycisphaerae bacterium]HON66725.1 sigma-70 family RNA polymerase sigma factor [Phycisphaerae bacterium]HPU28302.1 sigma-70 family RNA polymerase sigma factor [Phycisphaerae bacterium]
MQTTQTNLLSAVRDSQNREAWGHFYRIYAPMLRNFGRRLGVNETDLDDLTQEVLMIAHRSLCDDVYDPAKGRFRMWLFGIARRKALETLRARGRRTRVQQPACTEGNGVDLLAQIEDPRTQETMQQIWQQEWRYALLDEALRQIRTEVGEKEYQAFVRYAVERQPVAKVAEELGITSSSVYVYKSRVLTAIQKWVERFEEE